MREVVGITPLPVEEQGTLLCKNSKVAWTSSGLVQAEERKHEYFV